MNFLDNLDYKSMTKNISLLGMTDEFFCLYISMQKTLNFKISLIYNPSVITKQPSCSKRKY